MFSSQDHYFMELALQQARIAKEKGEIPVGAIITCNGTVIGKGHNQSEKLQDITAHAEIIALTAANHYLNNKNLRDCTLYVTLEPCVMCCGALYWSQIKRIVYAGRDIRRKKVELTALLHPKTTLQQGLLEEQAIEILQTFFKEKRSKN